MYINPTLITIHIYGPHKGNPTCNNLNMLQGRQTEAKRWKENRGQLGDNDAQEIENHWRKALEEKDAESRIRENKLQEEIDALKKTVQTNKTSCNTEHVP